MLARQLAVGTFVTTALFWQSLAALAQSPPAQGPIVSAPVAARSSPAARTLKSPAISAPRIARPRINPLANEPDQGRRGTWNRTSVPVDPLAGRSAGTRASPPVLLSFDGIGNPASCGGCTPPDTVGDVGPNHYIQMANSTKVSIYNKTGTLLTPAFDLGSLWTSGNCAANAGDPVVRYDGQADRWVLSQFNGASFLCFAVSQTPDPTGAYYTYEFNVGSFPDYFKVGVWPDGYYVSANETSYTAYAFDRAMMLIGQPATFQKFTGETNFLLPSDLDGKTPPPAGAPNLFYTFKDNSFHGGVDRIELLAFHVDWAVPGNSTFTLLNTINVAPFTYTVCGFFVLSCISQGGTAQKVDPVSEWPMFAFPYRNSGGVQRLAGTFTIGGSPGQAGAAPRWFELRNTGTGWTLFQEGTINPGDGKDRWMGSIAMDKVGNLAIGYSVSNSTMFPDIRYTVHRFNDAPGTTQTETVLISGGGSQTGSNRWGDYSAMSIDPSDDTSFWYTNEYYAASSSTNWATRIGKFRVMDNIIPRSVGANDGDILESSETSGAGGAINSTLGAVRLGDSVGDRQRVAILDFDTSILPDTAVVTGAALTVFSGGPVSGSDPFATLGNIAVDITGSLFSGDLALVPGDFEAGAGLANAGVITKPASGIVYSAKLSSAANGQVNATGRTQLRLRFQTDDDDDGIADILRLGSGDNTNANLRPRLAVEYYMP